MPIIEGAMRTTPSEIEDHVGLRYCRLIDALVRRVVSRKDEWESTVLSIHTSKRQMAKQHQPR